MKVMLDTNIVLDVLLRREPFFGASYAVMKQAALGSIDAFISASAATDIYYLLRRSLRDAARAKLELEKLMRLTVIADALAEDVHAALAAETTDFEDALLACIAARCRMDFIITRDAKDYRGSPVPALAPDAFLNMHSDS